MNRVLLVISVVVTLGLRLAEGASESASSDSATSTVFSGSSSDESISESGTGDLVYSANASLGCTAAQSCFTTLCSCLGTSSGSTNAAALVCIEASTANCTAHNLCLSSLTSCLNSVATATTVASGCATWAAPIQTASASVGAGTWYNATALYTSQCKGGSLAEWQSALGSDPENCTLQATTVCRSPKEFVGTLTLSGSDWGLILGSATSAASLRLGLEVDLNNALGFAAVVESMRVGSLIVQFAVGSPVDSSLTANLKSLATNTNWLTQTKAAYTAGGGTETLSVNGISQVSGSFTTTDASSSSSGSSYQSSSSSTIGTYSPQSYEELVPLWSMTITLAIVGVVALLIILIICCCGCKKRAEYKRMLERR